MVSAPLITEKIFLLTGQSVDRSFSGKLGISKVPPSAPNQA
jgi:hypothetical protein